MPRVHITRRVHWNSAHRLFRPDWSDEQNTAVYGVCANQHGHGHNYEMEVTVSGEVDPETGYVIDLKELKVLAERHVVDDLDHRHLNDEVPWLEGIVPTTENLVVAIWRRLAPQLPDHVTLERIVLWETPRHSVEYTRALAEAASAASGGAGGERGGESGGAT